MERPRSIWEDWGFFLANTEEIPRRPRSGSTPAHPSRQGVFVVDPSSGAEFFQQLVGWSEEVKESVLKQL